MIRRGGCSVAPCCSRWAGFPDPADVRHPAVGLDLQSRPIEYKGTSINHPEGVRLLITRYKPKAQCRDTQTSVNCVPTGRDNGNK